MSAANCIALTYMLMPCWKNFRSCAAMLCCLSFRNLLRHQLRAGLCGGQLNNHPLHINHGASPCSIVLSHHHATQRRVRIGQPIQIDDPRLQVQIVVLQKLPVWDTDCVTAWEVDHEARRLLKHFLTHLILSSHTTVSLLDLYHAPSSTLLLAFHPTQDKG